MSPAVALPTTAASSFDLSTPAESSAPLIASPAMSFMLRSRNFPKLVIPAPVTATSLMGFLLSERSRYGVSIRHRRGAARVEFGTHVAFRLDSRIHRTHVKAHVLRPSRLRRNIAQ